MAYILEIFNQGDGGLYRTYLGPIPPGPLYGGAGYFVILFISERTALVAKIYRKIISHCLFIASQTFTVRNCNKY